MSALRDLQGVRIRFVQSEDAKRVRGDHPNRPMTRRLGGKSKIVRHYGESK
jgi:hypothetical protein